MTLSAAPAVDAAAAAANDAADGADAKLPTALTAVDAAEAALRKAMIDSQLRPNAVTDSALLAAVATVARLPFAGGADRTRAYADRAIPLGKDRALNPVLTTARLIGAAEIAPGQSVLLIGAATGYTAALLAAMGVRVTAVESDATLATTARALLADVAGVTLVEAPLNEGAQDGAPYDALIIDGAIEELPAALVAPLADGARVVAGLAAPGGLSHLSRGVRVAGVDAVHCIAFAELESVPLPGFERPRRFTF